MTSMNGVNEEDFQHFLRTGRYHWQGVSFPTTPHQLEVDLGRGVMYMHSLLTGITALRVCRIPGRILWQFVSGVISEIDLKTIVPDAVGESTKLKGVITKEPVFLDVPEFTNGGGSFIIHGYDALEEALQRLPSRHFFAFWSVPVHVMKNLWMGEMVDITIGVTGR